jgi:hypothetical protein
MSDRLGESGFGFATTRRASILLVVPPLDGGLIGVDYCPFFINQPGFAIQTIEKRISTLQLS